MKVEFSGGTGTLNQGFGYRQFRGEMCSKDKLNMIFLHFCEEKSFSICLLKPIYWLISATRNYDFSGIPVRLLHYITSRNMLLTTYTAGSLYLMNSFSVPNNLVRTPDFIELVFIRIRQLFVNFRQNKDSTTINAFLPRRLQIAAAGFITEMNQKSTQNKLTTQFPLTCGSNFPQAQNHRIMKKRYTCYLLQLIVKMRTQV